MWLLAVSTKKYPRDRRKQWITSFLSHH